MRHMMKMTLAALASLALLPTAATAHTVKAPHPGKVVVLTYYPSGTFHGAVDIASGDGCNYWGVQTAVVGSVYWNITINSATSVCIGDGSSLRNEARHIWADGWSFRIWHFNKTASSYDRTCDRCQVGDEGATGLANSLGPRTHLHQDKNGTRDTSWYAGLSVGDVVTTATTLGALD